jgi:predicted MFS family arabinose efflux permease
MFVALAFTIATNLTLGRLIDWHAVFLIIGTIGVVDLVLLTAFLPPMPQDTRTTLGERLEPVRHRTVLITLSMTLAGVLSEFTLYDFATSSSLPNSGASYRSHPHLAR